MTEESSLQRECRRRGTEGEDTCLVYADWLEDRGRHDDAMKQRRRCELRRARRFRRATRHQERTIRELRAQRFKQRVAYGDVDYDLVFTYIRMAIILTGVVSVIMTLLAKGILP